MFPLIGNRRDQNRLARTCTTGDVWPFQLAESSHPFRQGAITIGA